MKAYTLKLTRECMKICGIASCATIENAQKITGNANSCEPYLSNMILALCMMSWRNTREDWQRLEAALMVRAAKRRAKR